jgi:LysR family glycine cleavage system transcriptional activator
MGEIMSKASGLQLPPLAAVRVFDAAARHLSFTRAAAELGMTQAAVSYQIKQLEDRVGSPLFRRLTRRLELTEAGLRLAGPVGEALGRLADAFAAARAVEDDVLKITAIHTFAANWLVPRLARFETAYPHINVWLDSSGRMYDLVADEIDIGIRTGFGDWPGLEAEPLLPVALTPMASPALIAQYGGIKTPADLMRMPLFREDDDSWEAWFALAGHPVPAGVAKHRRLDSQQLMGKAAVDGHGVALLNPAFFAEDNKAGRLVQPFPYLLTSRRLYYLAYPKARRHTAKIQAFRTWLLAEMATDCSAVIPS